MTAWAGGVVQRNEYDGLGRRIVRVDAASPDVTYDCYYNDRWQLLTRGQGRGGRRHLPVASVLH